MKKCPYCAEEIQDEAIKCKHCGEFLDIKVNEGPVCTECGGKLSSDKQFCTECGVMQTGENDQIIPLNAKFQKQLDYDQPIKQNKGDGKYTCPNCKSTNTTSTKAIGCAVLIIIFISLGLGLIMIPFLPYDCRCNDCGYNWRT